MDAEHPPTGPTALTHSESTGFSRAPGAQAAAIIAVILAGILLGTFQVANTSIGWHIASGRWMIENRSFIRADVFSFTSGHAPWIDHEWLFQIIAAAAHGLGGSPGLVALRALTVAVLAVLLLIIGLRSGLSPPLAVLVSLACVVGARPRFFVRPELVTLLVVPAASWLYLTRQNRSLARWLAPLAAIMLVGGNCHGGALVVPVFLGGMLAAETAAMLLCRRWSSSVVWSGLAGFMVAVLALTLNPYGWHVFAVPFKLMELVDQPHIPNPEWVSPSLAQTPALFLAAIAALVILALRERGIARWALFLMSSYLAFRHIRNLGLFYVLLPLIVAPALASWSAFSARGRRVVAATAYALGAAVVISAVAAPWPRFGVTYANGYYPSEACDFLDSHELPKSQLYNDVRFGGYLIERYAPARLVFQDDRNEIHEPLLEEIWSILRSSDVRRWAGLLGRHGCDTALVRYHAPIHSAPADGKGVGTRGFSALWFPSKSWALVYWDDVAMVFVRRAEADPRLLKDFEYRVIRPDDLEYLRWRVVREPGLRETARSEARRAIDSTAENRLAEKVAAFLAAPGSEQITGP